MAAALLDRIVSPKVSGLKQLTPNEVDSLSSVPFSNLPLSELLWRLELFAFKDEANKIVYIGFGQGDYVHEHDQWLFVKEEDKEWEYTNPGCARKVASTVPPERRMQARYFLGHEGPISESTFQLTVERLNKLVTLIRRDNQSTLGSEQIITTARLFDSFVYTPGILNSLDKGLISPKDVHNLVCHPEEYKRQYPAVAPLPVDYIKRLNNIELF